MDEQTPKPMDPELLARMRDHLDTTYRAVDALLADRDYWEAKADENQTLALNVDLMRQGQIDEANAEAKRWRDRCPVEVEDVTASGLTGTKVRAWLTSQSWSESNDTGTRGHLNSVTWRLSVGDHRGIPVYDEDRDHLLLSAVRSAACHFQRSTWDILDEMATMEATP